MKKSDNTVYQELKENGFEVTRNQIKDLGINPDKEWDRIKLLELKAIANELDVAIKDLF